MGRMPIRYGTTVATTTSEPFQLLSLLGKGGRDAWLVVEAGMPVDSVATDPRRFDMDAIAPGALPTAFSNPFLLDIDGDHQWSAPGLPTKAAP